MSNRSWSLIVGVGLILLGALALLGQFVNLDWGRYGWPLFILVPGLVLAVAGRRGPASLFAAGFAVITVGLILLVQNLTGFFASWSYAWALVPASVGLALLIRGRAAGRPDLVSAGRWLLLVWPIVFLVGFVFFELIIGVDGFRNAAFARYALPALLILGGGALLIRNLLAGRRQE